MASIFKRRGKPPVLLFLVIFPIHLSCSVAADTYSNHSSVGGMPQVHCLPDQASALLRLKRSFTVTGESACTLSSWRAGTDCCRWEGIQCRDANGLVTSLDLGDCGLESPALDHAVFRLNSLRHLNLAWNDFNYSQLPASGFERLAELRHLNLSTSSFDGHIPVGISGLTNLVSLDLSTTFHIEEDLDINVAYGSITSAPVLPPWANALEHLKAKHKDGPDRSIPGRTEGHDRQNNWL